MVKARLRSLLGWSEAESSGGKRAPEKKPARPKRYQSVSVVCGSKCCAAVKMLSAERFLAGSAPALPLASCTVPEQCNCCFRKYDDRRDDNRRLPGEMTRWYGGTEKRLSRGRRQVD